MRRNPAVWSGVSILGVLIVCPLAWGQAVPAAQKVIPLPTDWSHAHVIFSKPATTEQAERVEKDPAIGSSGIGENCRFCRPLRRLGTRFLRVAA